ncbi:hypothetical protein ACFL30_03255 [Candidatus Latescibacterota bacterium]
MSKRNAKGKASRRKGKGIQPKAPGRIESVTNKLLRKFHKFDNHIIAHLLLFSVLVISVLFICELLFFVPVYQTNDDVGMSWVASGKSIVDTPDEHLLYQNVVLGFLLKKLYAGYPNFPWYGLYHFLVHYLCMIMFLYIILSIHFSLKRLFLFLVFFIGLELGFLNNLQFTITSFMAGQTGIFLFLAFLGDRSLKSWFLLIFSIILLLISSIIRIDSFYLVLLIASPILFITFVTQYKKFLVVVKYSIFIFATISLSFLLKNYNTSYYSNDPEWKDFRKINTVKARFIDYNQIYYNNDTKSIFDEVNWSRNDLYILRTWFYADETIFSTENMEKVASQFPKYRPEITLHYVITTFTNVFNSVVFLLIMVLLFVIYVPVKKIDYAIIVSTFLLICLIMLFLMLTMHLPARVYYPVFSFLVMLCLFKTCKTINFSFYGLAIAKYFLITLIVIGLSVIIVRNVQEGKKNTDLNSKFRQVLESLNISEDQLYVIWGASLPFENNLPFENTDYLSDFKILSLSTYLPTPFTRKRLEKYSIENLYEALYKKDNVFLVVNNMRDIYFYTEYVREHFDVDVQFAYIYKSNKINVLKVFDDTDPRINKETEVNIVRDPYTR